MRVCRLSNVAHELNAALGSGRFRDITMADVRKHIDQCTIFEFLSERLGIGVPLSVLSPVDRLELSLDWDSMSGCVERFRFDGHLNGLCLLNGYLLKGIARRSVNTRYRLTPERSGKAEPGGGPDELM